MFLFILMLTALAIVTQIIILRLGHDVIGVQQIIIVIFTPEMMVLFGCHGLIKFKNKFSKI